MSSSTTVKRSSRLHAAAKRSSRTILDADARRDAIAARIATLERDNYIEQTEDEYKDNNDDEEEQILVGEAKAAKGAKGAKANSKRKNSRGDNSSADGGGKRKVRVGLLDLVEKLGMREAGAVEPNYVTATSSPPTHPPRSFCTVCGYMSCYTCVRCGMRYCSIACQRTHNETTCVKFGM